MTRLYLVRHGTAHSAEVDPEKHLSPEGLKEIEKMGKKIAARHSIGCCKFIHSDKARAIETAEVLRDEIAKGCPCNEHPGLAPNDEPGDLIPELEALKEDWVIVSHLPYLDRLLSQLITGSDQHKLVNFGPGTTVCLSHESNGWLIEWVEL